MKSINEILREQFLKAFENAKKQYEAELKQKPFYGIQYKNKKGEISHTVRMCNN